MGVVKHSPARIGRVIGARIKATREAMGISQGELSVRAGMSAISLERLETCGIGKVLDLCQCLWILGLGEELVDALTRIEPEIEIPTGIVIPGLENMTAEEKAERQARIAAEAPGWRKLLQDVADMVNERFGRNRVAGRLPTSQNPAGGIQEAPPHDLDDV